MRRLSSSFIAWRKMWASRVRGGQRRSAKWKALLESCRRKIDTGRLYTTQFLSSSSSFSSPSFLFDPSPVFFLSSLSPIYSPLSSPLFDYVSRIASWPFVRYRSFKSFSSSLPYFSSEYRWPKSHETLHCRIKWNCQPNSKNNFLSFRKFPPQFLSSQFRIILAYDFNCNSRWNWSYINRTLLWRNLNVILYMERDKSKIFHVNKV